MRIQQRSYLAALAVAAISACSSRSTALPVPLAATGGPTSTAPAAGTRAKLTIVVPRPATTTSATQRRPLYVSPASANFVVAVNGGSPTTYGLTPQSPGCSIVVANLTCSFSLIAPAGQDAFTFNLTDGGNNVLSHNVVMATLAPGVVTPVNVTLSAVVASVKVLPGVGSAMDGTASPFHFPGLFAQPLEAEAFDADGNVIIGPGAPSITGVASDSTIASVSPISGSDPNAYLLRPVDGTAGGKTVNVSATFQGATLTDGTAPAPVSGRTAYTFTPALLAATGPHVSVYSVESLNQIASFNACPGTCPLTLVSDATVDSKGQLYVLYHQIAAGIGSRNQSTLAIFPPGATLPALQIGASAGIHLASGVAVSKSGTVYVANNIGNVVEFAPGATSSSFTISGTPPSPGKIAVDGNGNVFVADLNGGAVDVYPPNSQTPSGTLTDPSMPNPDSLAVDASGGLYVADLTNPNVAFFPAGQTTATSVLSDASFGVSPGPPLLIDPLGNLWVSETGGAVIERLAASALPNAVSIDLTFNAPSVGAGSMGWIP